MRLNEMKFMRTLVFTVSMLVSSCELSKEASCRNYESCAAGDHGVILSGSAAERKRALSELDAAASTFYHWTGHEAPFGFVILRNSRDIPHVWGFDRPWVLYFDKAETKRIEEALPKVIAHPAGIHLSVPDGGVESYDEGDLAHEICHKYVEEMSARFGAARPAPDLVNEAAAISCEPASGRDERLRVLYNSANKSFNSDGLFNARNPLSFDLEMLKKAGVPVDEVGPHTINFTIEPNVGLSKSVADFYGRAALLQEYLRRNRCNGLRAVGSLIQSSIHGESFDRWLLIQSKYGCILDNRVLFDAQVSNFAARFKHK